MEPGQEHFKIKPEELQRLQSMSESERIQRFEEKFDEWIKTIERFLSTEPEPKNEGLEPGPKTELEFWKERMQTITNWSEQLKNKDFNMVKMALIKYKQNEGKKEGQ
jgi:dynein heavy chain, axonemal